MLLNCDSTFLYEVHVIVTTSHKHKNPRQFGGFKNLFSFSSYFSISTSSVLSSEIYSVTSPESGSFVIASVDEAVSSLFSDASTLELSILFSASDFKEA